MKKNIHSNKEDLDAVQLITQRGSSKVKEESTDVFLDEIVACAARICEMEIAAISILDNQGQRFKSSYGMDVKTSEKSIAFCNHAVLQEDVFEINDVFEDPRFKSNLSAQSDPKIRFYTGIPLVDDDGLKLGTLCILDSKPKVLTDLQKELLRTLSKSVSEHLVHTKNRLLLEKKRMEMDNFFFLSPDLLCEATMDGYFKRVSRSFIAELGYTEAELKKIPFIELVHEQDRDETRKAMERLVEHEKSVTFFYNRYRCKDGSYVTLSWNAIPHSASKTIYATARNITQLELLKEEVIQNKVKELERSREKFISLSSMTKNVSKELLEPANLIIGFADVAREMLKEMQLSNSSDERSHLADRIQEDLQRITRHGEFISRVLNKMNSEAEGYQIPSVISRIELE